MRDRDLGDDYGPGKNPEKVGTESLIEVPARGGSEENSGKLVIEGIEDIGPVDGLYDGGKVSLAKD